MSSKKIFYEDEVWERIEELYLVEPDPIKIMKKTGIPVSIIRDTVQDQLVKRLKGGEEVWNIASKEFIPKRQKIDIIYACRADDGVSVDTKKAKKFLSYFKDQDNTLRGELIKATKRNPGASVSDWIESAENAERDIEKMKSHGALQAEIRASIPDLDERFKFLSELIEEMDNE